MTVVRIDTDDNITEIDSLILALIDLRAKGYTHCKFVIQYAESHYLENFDSGYEAMIMAIEPDSLKERVKLE